MIDKILEKISTQIEENETLPNFVNDGETFEKHVYDLFQQLKQVTEFDINSVEHNGKHSFPDLKIVFNDGATYGIEIKFSASGNWHSKGNSVFETHSNKEQDTENGYKEIYVLFGRKPKSKEATINYQVKYAPYGNCIDKIEVTHSPRFSINMNVGEKNLFNTLGLQDGYAKFRTKDTSLKNDFLRKYFNTLTNTNEANKWYIDKTPSVTGTQVDEELKIQPIPFTSLNLAKKRIIISEAFILFPKDLFKDRAHYSNVMTRMISKHFVYSSSLRDSFSGGGKAFVISESVRHPQMLKTFYEHQDTVKELLRNSDEEFEKDCFTNWEKAFGSELINKEKDIEENYENIIKKFRPMMEIETFTPLGKLQKVNAEIELSDFYHSGTAEATK